MARSVKTAATAAAAAALEIVFQRRGKQGEVYHYQYPSP